ncbi:hypothetical protein I203_100981 [Kwoniella mangroviensis CBS 8507]|uniref:uncharacterized protein n=1 Tax=Kwoniella mangroviensis CBS 8507 TaxID=1296122 RepID=UPI0030231D5A
MTLPGSYTSQEGASVPYAAGFDGGQGDFVVISSDKKAFCAESSKLAEASKVFRYMLEVSDSNQQKELKLDHCSEVLHIFLSALMDRYVNLEYVQWSRIKEVGALFLRFETCHHGPELLKSWIRAGPCGVNHFEMFVLASKFDDVATGSWVIRDIGCPGRIGHPGEFWTKDRWPQSELRQLSSAWIGAYAKAHAQCQEKYECLSSTYWRAIASGFLANVLSVSLNLFEKLS